MPLLELGLVLYLNFSNILLCQLHGLGLEGLHLFGFTLLRVDGRAESQAARSKFSLQLLDQFLGFPLQFLGLNINWTALLIIQLTICPNLLNINRKSVKGFVDAILHIRFDS